MRLELFIPRVSAGAGSLRSGTASAVSGRRFSFLFLFSYCVAVISVFFPLAFDISFDDIHISVPLIFQSRVGRYQGPIV